MSKRPTPIAPSASGDPRKGNSQNRKSPKRQHIQLSSEAPFSEGVLLGNTLYLAGRIGVDHSGNHVPDDIETEARNVMNSVETVLHRAGMQMDDLVYVQIFCPDVALWARFNKIYSTYFKSKLPARAFVGSGKLLFDAHFEVQGIAVKG